MSPELGELVAALPDDVVDERAPEQALRELLETLGRKPVPVGRLARFWALGSLKAKIALAYLAWWVRSGYVSDDERIRALNETHLKAALKLLGAMTYLRGAIMKIGQALANYPDVVPEQFVDTLGSLHFEAPPMHFSLLREQVRNELDAEPEELFDDFETRAFAAASLGQVHRARLKTGQRVAVKIQYPNIARTIRDDFRNFNALLMPMRLSSEWENLKAQGEDVFRTLEMETEYEQEAGFLEIARGLFREEDEVVVPRVHRRYSTRRVLTMDYLPGRHVAEYMATNPSEQGRDRHGHQLYLAGMRLYYAGRMIYADPHPGNFLFMDDGRLGLIDFGCCYRFTDDTWDYCCQVERASRKEPRHPDMRPALSRGSALGDAGRLNEEWLGLLLDYCEWLWEPNRSDGPFYFGEPESLRRGMHIFGELVRRGYTRSQPINTWIGRSFIGLRAMAYRLRARVNLRKILEQETTVE